MDFVRSAVWTAQFHEQHYWWGIDTNLRVCWEAVFHLVKQLGQQHCKQDQCANGTMKYFYSAVYVNCTIKTLHGAFCTLFLIADNGYSARQAVKVTNNALFSKAFVYRIENIWNTYFTAVWLLRGHSWHDLLPFADVWKFAHNSPPKNAYKLIVHQRSIAPETEDVLCVFSEVYCEVSFIHLRDLKLNLEKTNFCVETIFDIYGVYLITFCW